jgi:hypothetical protein
VVLNFTLVDLRFKNTSEVNNTARAATPTIKGGSIVCASTAANNIPVTMVVNNSTTDRLNIHPKVLFLNIKNPPASEMIMVVIDLICDISSAVLRLIMPGPAGLRISEEIDKIQLVKNIMPMSSNKKATNFSLQFNFPIILFN